MQLLDAILNSHVLNALESVYCDKLRNAFPKASIVKSSASWGCSPFLTSLNKWLPDNTPLIQHKLVGYYSQELHELIGNLVEIFRHFLIYFHFFFMKIFINL